MIISIITMFLFIICIFSASFWQGPAGFSLVRTKTNKENGRINNYNSEINAEILKNEKSISHLDTASAGLTFLGVGRKTDTIQKAWDKCK